MMKVDTMPDAMRSDAIRCEASGSRRRRQNELNDIKKKGHEIRGGLGCKSDPGCSLGGLHGILWDFPRVPPKPPAG